MNRVGRWTVIAGIFVAMALSGCAYAPVWTAVGTRVKQTGELEPFSEAKLKIPPLADGHTRLFIYRPQALVGALGAPVVIVDGTWFGDANDPANNRLLPGAVFVVDSPAPVTQVWWYQAGRGEEKDKTLNLPASEARTWYLRWSLKPTYGFLERVDEAEAIKQIEPLRFGGYIRLQSAPSAR